MFLFHVELFAVSREVFGLVLLVELRVFTLGGEVSTKSFNDFDVNVGIEVGFYGAVSYTHLTLPTILLV